MFLLYVYKYKYSNITTTNVIFFVVFHSLSSILTNYRLVYPKNKSLVCHIVK